MMPLFRSLRAVQEAAERLPGQPAPDKVWRAVFLDAEPTHGLPVPPKLYDRIHWGQKLGESKRYLGTIVIESPVTKERQAEYEAKWRSMVLSHGAGTYNFFDCPTEDQGTPVHFFGSWKVMFVTEEDVQEYRLGLGQTPLTDEQVTELETTFMEAVHAGDATKAELLAFEYERRGMLKDARRVSLAGMDACDHDPGIWDEYREEKRPQRDVHRRLLALQNRVCHKIFKGPSATLYSTDDCGEADPERACEKCGKKGALPAQVVIGSVWMCYTCRRLPRSEWPQPKPIASFAAFARSNVGPERCSQCDWVGNWDGAVCPECGAPQVKKESEDARR